MISPSGKLKTFLERCKYDPQRWNLMRSSIKDLVATAGLSDEDVELLTVGPITKLEEAIDKDPGVAKPMAVVWLKQAT